MQLKDIAGHERVTEMLNRAIKNKKVAHAYLFYGDEGVGKKTIARAFAHQLLCEHESACQRCASCRRYLSGNHSSYRELIPEKSIKIQEVRELQRSSSYSMEGYRIYLIDNLELMTVQAANSFLKTLEEPTANTVFLLLTKVVDQILPTIQSRCQMVACRRLPDRLVIEELQKNIAAARDDVVRCELVATMARGSIGRAISLWEGHAFQRRTEVIELLVQLPKVSIPVVLGMSLRWEEQKEQVLLDLEIIQSWYRDLLCLQSNTGIRLHNPDYRNELLGISKLYSKEALHQIIQMVGNTIPGIKANARPRFSVNRMLLMMNKGALT